MKLMKNVGKIIGLISALTAVMFTGAYAVWVPDAWDVYPEEFYKIYEVSSKYTTDKMDKEYLTIKNFKGKSYKTGEPLAEGMDLKTLALQFREDSGNNDVVGWIYVPKTNINYPIVQHENDTDYYVNRNYWHFENKNEAYGFPGVIWVDSFCKFDELNNFAENTVINGHNWENYKGLPTYPEGPKIDDFRDIMFSQFHSYLDYNYAKERPYIYISTLKENIILKIFAVYCTEEEFKYYVTNLNESEKLYILQEAMNRTIYDYGSAVYLSDKIFTFSTCTRAYGKGRQDQRFVIMARPLRDGETIDDSVTIVKRENYKLPNMKKLDSNK